MKKNYLIVLFILFTVLLNAQVFDNRSNSSNLLSNAAISVTIGGNFPVTGSFPAFISERVDQFVTRLSLEAIERSGKIFGYSLRGIILKRSDGEEILVDLKRFRITGNFVYNPYLKNDDVVIFPVNDIDRNFFTISGAVNNPNIFFYVEGDSLSDALELAMGVNEAYEKVNSVAISRLSYNGESLETDTVNINSEIKLQRGDQIKVIAPETQRKNYHISVLGEVKNPGNVAITKSSTTLYNVIEAVGGFTENASLKRSRLYTGNSVAVSIMKRKGINTSELPDLEDVRFRNSAIDLETMLMYRMSNVFIEDSAYFILENQLRVLTEGTSLDFSKLIDPDSDVSNYIVQNQDVIIIPKIAKSVYVFGQIRQPGYVPLVEGEDYTYYINKAGGLGELAIVDEIMVIQGASRSWISPLDNKVTIEESDYIFVPKEQLRSLSSRALEYSLYVGMLASVATVILLIVTLLR